MTTQSTDNHIDEGYKLPSVIKVEVGTVSIPTDFDLDNLSQYETVNREITHLLALIPDEDKAEAEYDSDEKAYLIKTSNPPALKYAVKKYFIDDCFTVIDTVANHIINHFDGQVCHDCVDNFIDQALDESYETVVLEEGVFIRKEVD
jgi:hypothetical protein